MKKTILIIAVSSFFLGACVDKKAEEKKKAELEAKIEAVDKETNQEVESLEKETKEIENALSELDNL